MKALRRPAPAERLRWMHDQLAEAYGPQHWWPAETAFEVILGAYLTQNTPGNPSSVPSPICARQER